MLGENVAQDLVNLRTQESHSKFVTSVQMNGAGTQRGLFGLEAGFGASGFGFCAATTTFMRGRHKMPTIDCQFEQPGRFNSWLRLFELSTQRRVYRKALLAEGFVCFQRGFNS